MTTLLRALLLLALWSSTLGIAIDNGLVGEPEVECGSDRVEMQIRTQKPFAGKVFVKGHYGDAACRMDYSGAGVGSRPTAGIIVGHGACDMSRQRMISPQGMQFSAVVVVSFHPTFITKVDRAFHIKCMYRESSKTVTARVDVSPLTTELLSQDLPMPTCTYTIRADEIDGDILKYATVGQQVVHRWECQSELYGILVHSCYITDGQGERVSIVDERGCHVDRFLLGDPTYTESLAMAYRESHVFKFADRVAVRFQCQIRLCLKEDGGCNGITPPICDGAAEPRNASLKLNEALPAQLRKAADISERQTETEPKGAANSPPKLQLRKTHMTANISTTTTTGKPETRAQLDSAPSILLRRTEMEQRLPGLFRRRVYRSADSAPLDGDFNSQTLYVLDTTEEPTAPGEGGSEQSRLELRHFLRNSGAIVGEMGAGVCLGSATFALMLGSVILVFFMAAILIGALFCAKLRQSSDGKRPSWSNIFN